MLYTFVKKIYLGATQNTSRGECMDVCRGSNDGQKDIQKAEEEYTWRYIEGVMMDRKISRKLKRNTHGDI